MRTATSSVRGLCQALVINIKDIPTSALSTGYFVSLDAKGKYSLSVCAVARGSPSVVPSVVLVNTDKDPGVMDKPGNRR